MRNEAPWATLTARQKQSRVIMQLNKLEDEAVADMRDGGPCIPRVVANWMRSKADRIEARNGAPKRRARRKLEIPYQIAG